MFVRRKHLLESGKSANQGEQCGTRQMKIRKQRCDYPKAKARNNKDLCFRLSWMQQSSRPGFPCFPCRIFEGPDYGRAHGTNRSTRGVRVPPTAGRVVATFSRL